MLLGCIADDFTGATDLASNLARSGMRVVQTIGVPGENLREDVDAVVVSLKSRTIAAEDAVSQSLAALQWLQAGGAQQIYFKICSTFDSTDSGNIGPVAEALMDALGCDFSIACPAFPVNGRTVYKGYLFTGDVLLSEGSMKSHPLTPMTDPNLVRVLQRQCQGKVGLIEHAVVRLGTQAIRARMAQLRLEGTQLAIVDALDDADLMAMGLAFAGLPLLVAGSGVAIGLPQNHALVATEETTRLPAAQGHRAVISGSCSLASIAQVVDFRQRGGATWALDPLRLAAGDDVAGAALGWAAEHMQDGPVLIHATADADVVRQVQAALGPSAGGHIEAVLSAIALGLVAMGVRQLIVAGGETSGACVGALGVERLTIGPQIDPGVPWCFAHARTPPALGLHLALKSGNFGSVDFFTKAFAALQ